MESEIHEDEHLEWDQLKLRAGQVFQPSTPINRRQSLSGRWEQLTTIADAVNQPGLHVVIYGERGVGKTSIANVIDPLLHVLDHPDDPNSHAPGRPVIIVNANSEDRFSDLWHRAFENIEWEIAAPKFGLAQGHDVQTHSAHEFFDLPSSLTVDHVRRVLSKLPGSVFIFDEFDRLDRPTRRLFTDLIKTLSDRAIESTIILVGVSETVDELIEDHASINRAIVQVPMPRMTSRELMEILEKASKALSIQFDEHASESIVKLSQGLPHYTHLVGLNSVRCACDVFTKLVGVDHVHAGCMKSVVHAQQTVRANYSNAIHSSHPGALYSQILLACAISAAASNDEQGFFQPAHIIEPLSEILGKLVQVSTFNKHLNEFASDDKRGRVLERRGQPRSYRFRFRDPLMPPYIMMKAIESGAMDKERLRILLAESRD
jgi:Cdc6-like AAA superfamily ATPase